MLKRSIATALVVGTILVTLNQGDLIIASQGTSALYWKIPLTYLVPFMVSTWGALTNARR
ncbi:MAG: nitrate/nitrite transporter NrtS [Chloroflexi bacterium]|nr:nitrate/nitrite transporter NrtS [Chloroflexota bacterium]